MDIFNRPPTIAEDTLHYTIRPQPTQSSRVAVTSLAALIHAFVQQLLPNFIWHRDPFELKAVHDSSDSHKWDASDTDRAWYLEGRMRVGDSVDDEWCVVWLLWEISTRWDVAISVNDSDGEFLLIEAADYLPNWVEPSNAENRVWIYKGKLQLIPLTFLSPPSTKPRRQRYEDEDDASLDSREGWLNVSDALRVLWSDGEETDAPQGVQDSILRRISGYPEAALNHLHVAKALLPVDIAKALSQDPSLVQKAAEAFYTRDAIQLRAAQRMARFSPQHSILTTFKITRTAYAQLSGQKFHPPKVFGTITEPEGTREWKWKDIGMKIACGFEMLYQESKSRSSLTSADSQSATAEARLEALRRNPEYTQYIDQLQSAGYFKEEREGSAQWKVLELRAMDVFILSRADDDASRTSFATLVNNAIARADNNPIIPQLVEESDDWLNVDAEDFDNKLANTMQASRSGDANAMDVDDKTAEDAVAKEQADKLKGLAKKIENFVEGEGTLEGALVEDDALSEGEKLSDFSDEESAIDSDASGKMDEAEAALRKEALDRLVAGIDPADYGKMPPSFYSNSQRVVPATLENETVLPTSSPAAGTINTDGSTSRSQEEPLRKPVRRPILPRDKFDGVDSDDETDEDDPAQGDSEDEEDKPQVVGEVEIDMAQEQEEFLNFSRELLGISDEQWKHIVQERQDRGAFVPSGALKSERNMNDSTKRASEVQPSQKPGKRQADSLEAGTGAKANSIFNSFDEVMDAMEAELAKARSKKGTKKQPPPAPPSSSMVREKLDRRPGTVNNKEKGKAPQRQPSDKITSEDTDDDLEKEMDAELHAALAREDSDSDEDEPMDYNLMKNFLESFKSQAGLSGPVGNLAGRLEPAWKLPRDQT